MRSDRARRALLILATSLLAAGLCAQAGIPLRDLPALAKVRAERQRPAQMAALEPFLTDLKTDYRRNSEVLDKTIDKVVALGDAVFPVLVEQLTPSDGDSHSRFLADNSARVLAKLDPKAHVAIWSELAEGEHGIGRRLGIRLLGASGDPQAASTLARVFPKLADADERLAALDAAEEIGTPALAPLVVPMLQASDPDLRRRALQHLTRNQWSEAVPVALKSLSNERENALLGDYIAWFAATVHGDAQIAEALTPLLDSVRLDPGDAEKLVTALATIAPQDHKPTEKALLQLLDAGQIGPLGVRAALTLQALGEKRGKKILFDWLDKNVVKDRADANRYAARAEASLAFDQAQAAIRDFEDAIKYTRSNNWQQYYSFQIARCEAHRGNLKSMQKALRESQYSNEKILKEAAGDPRFLEQLEKAGIHR